jgi:hypothetical protein
MKRIEDAFQDLAAKIIDGRVSTIGDEEKRIADEFFALWYMRSRHRTLAAQEIQGNWNNWRRSLEGPGRNPRKERGFVCKSGREISRAAT